MVLKSHLLRELEKNNTTGQTKQTGLAEHQSDNEYETQSLSGMYNQHTPLWK